MSTVFNHICIYLVPMVCSVSGNTAHWALIWHLNMYEQLPLAHTLSATAPFLPACPHLQAPEARPPCEQLSRATVAVSPLVGFAVFTSSGPPSEAQLSHVVGEGEAFSGVTGLAHVLRGFGDRLHAQPLTERDALPPPRPQVTLHPCDVTAPRPGPPAQASFRCAQPTSLRGDTLPTLPAAWACPLPIPPAPALPFTLCTPGPLPAALGGGIFAQGDPRRCRPVGTLWGRNGSMTVTPAEQPWSHPPCCGDALSKGTATPILCFP